MPVIFCSESNVILHSVGPCSNWTSKMSSPAGPTLFNAMDWIAMILLIVGGLNWGLVGIADFDLVAAIFGDGSALSRIVYALVGASALYTIYSGSKLSRS